MSRYKRDRGSGFVEKFRLIIKIESFRFFVLTPNLYVSVVSIVFSAIPDATDVEWRSKFGVVPYQPYLAMPKAVTGMDPKWKSCVGYVIGWKDPPMAMRPIDSVSLPKITADPASQPGHHIPAIPSPISVPYASPTPVVNLLGVSVGDQHDKTRPLREGHFDEEGPARPQIQEPNQDNKDKLTENSHYSNIHLPTINEGSLGNNQLTNYEQRRTSAATGLHPEENGGVSFGTTVGGLAHDGGRSLEGLRQEPTFSDPSSQPHLGMSTGTKAKKGDGVTLQLPSGWSVFFLTVCLTLLRGWQ